MGDAVGGKFGQSLMQHDGVGSRQGSIAMRFRSDDAQCPDGSGWCAECGPDFTHKLRGRGFAVGPGDRGNMGGHGTEKSRRDFCQQPPWFIGPDDGGVAGRGHGGGRIGQNRGGSFGQRVGDKGAAIQFDAGHGGEQSAGADLPRIRRQRRDHGIAAHNRITARCGGAGGNLNVRQQTG